MRYQVQATERSDERIRFELTFPSGSPLFTGHFPDNPILPGVAQLLVCSEVLSEALDRPLHIAKIDSVRYRKPILPEMACELSVSEPSAEGQVDFKWSGPDGPISEGRIHVGGSHD